MRFTIATTAAIVAGVSASPQYGYGYPAQNASSSAEVSSIYASASSSAAYAVSSVYASASSSAVYTVSYPISTPVVPESSALAPVYSTGVPSAPAPVYPTGGNSSVVVPAPSGTGSYPISSTTASPPVFTGAATKVGAGIMAIAAAAAAFL
jgi:hypothetical protein